MGLRADLEGVQGPLRQPNPSHFYHSCQTMLTYSSFSLHRGSARVWFPVLFKLAQIRFLLHVSQFAAHALFLLTYSSWFQLGFVLINPFKSVLLYFSTSLVCSRTCCAPQLVSKSFAHPFQVREARVYYFLRFSACSSSIP